MDFSGTRLQFLSALSITDYVLIHLQEIVSLRILYFHITGENLVRYDNLQNIERHI